MGPKDEWDLCEHGIPLEDYCEACEDPQDGELFDADELGLDPETDDERHYPGGARA
jgi:hypothetical protein